MDSPRDTAKQCHSNHPDIRMELTGPYLSPSIQGSYALSHVWAVNAGIRWNSANQKPV